VARLVRSSIAIVLFLGWIAAGVVEARGKPVWQLQLRAREAADIGEDKRADALYAKARNRAPENPFLSFDHAETLMRAGRTEDALEALDAAVASGFRLAARLERSEALAPLRDSPHWKTLLESTRATATEFEERLREAQRPIDPDRADVFPDLDTLSRAQERANREFYEYAGYEAYELRRARFAERWSAALTQLAGDKRNTPERERALIALVRLRVEEANALRLNWPQDSIDKVAASTSAYLDEFPDSENAAEARLARAVAGVAAPYPDDWYTPRSSRPQPRCAESLPAFEELSATGAEDPWSLTALGFEALCLDRINPARRVEIRAAARAYLATEDLSSTYDMMLRAELKVILWRIDGLPEFEAEGLDGNVVTLADFKGKVTLLDFWSPG